MLYVSFNTLRSLFDLRVLVADCAAPPAGARGDTAVYDFNRRIITMAGNVRLNRGGDTLNGGRLVIDLASGVSSVDGRASGSSSVTGEGQSGGRVTGSFSVPEN